MKASFHAPLSVRMKCLAFECSLTVIKRITGAFCVLLISSCTTFEDIDQGLTMLQGRSVDDLIGILGFPDGEQNVAGRRFVVWSSSQNVTTIIPITNYS